MPNPITALRQDDDGVDVTFDRAPPRRFDLVISADGRHSAVRGLVSGPETDCVGHLGLYVATPPLGHPAADPDTVLMQNMPGQSIAVHPARGNAGVAFIFRGPTIPGLDHRDTQRHKQIVLDTYRDGRGNGPTCSTACALPLTVLRRRQPGPHLPGLVGG